MVNTKTSKEDNDDNKKINIDLKIPFTTTSPNKKTPSIALLLSIMITVAFSFTGGVFFYDFPQLFEEVLITQFEVSTIEVGILYSIASAPTVLFTPFISAIASCIGLNTACVFMSALVFSGILVCYLGVAFQSFVLVVVGRGIFGLAYESSYVVSASCIEKWFTGRFLSMGFAFSRFLCYLLSSTAAYTQPELFIKFRNLETPLFLYATFGGFCTLMAFLYFLLDWKNENILVSKEDEEMMNEKITIKSLRNISNQAWLILAIFAVSSQCLYQFTNFGTDCLVKRFGFSYLEAKNRIALIPIVNMIMIPVFSSIISCVGKKGFFLTGGCVIITANYIFLSSLRSDGDERAVIGVIGVGIFYSLLTSSFWSSFSLLLPKQAVTALFGLAISCQNLLLAVLPPVFSYFSKARTPAAYQKCFYILIGIGGFSSILSLILTIKDIKGTKAMHLPENDHAVQEHRSRISQSFSAHGSKNNSLRGSGIGRSLLTKNTVLKKSRFGLMNDDMIIEERHSAAGSDDLEPNRKRYVENKKLNRSFDNN